MFKTLTFQFLDFTSEVRISRVSRRAQANGDVHLHITYGQRSAGVGARVRALETDTRQLRRAVVVRFAFPVAAFDHVVRIAYQIRRTHAGARSVPFATLRIGTAGVRRARIRQGLIRRCKQKRQINVEKMYIKYIFQ